MSGCGPATRIEQQSGRAEGPTTRPAPCRPPWLRTGWKVRSQPRPTDEDMVAVNDAKRDQETYTPSPEAVALAERLVEHMRELPPNQQRIFVQLIEAYLAVADEQRGR